MLTSPRLFNKIPTVFKTIQCKECGAYFSPLSEDFTVCPRCKDIWIADKKRGRKDKL